MQCTSKLIKSVLVGLFRQATLKQTQGPCARQQAPFYINSNLSITKTGAHASENVLVHFKVSSKANVPRPRSQATRTTEGQIPCTWWDGLSLWHCKGLLGFKSEHIPVSGQHRSVPTSNTSSIRAASVCAKATHVQHAVDIGMCQAEHAQITVQSG
eukprot:scaffold87877_cov18-Tisochrysis_lutea.AAC.1